MKVWNYLQQCWQVNSALSSSIDANSSPLTLSSLPKPRRKTSSPHIAVPLVVTTKGPGSTVFRFGVGAQPKLRSTTRARAESTETSELYQGSTSLLSACLQTETFHSLGFQTICGFHHLAQRSPLLCLSQSSPCLV